MPVCVYWGKIRPSPMPWPLLSTTRLNESHLEAWQLAAHALFGSLTPSMRVNARVLAPSSDNARPWTYSIDGAPLLGLDGGGGGLCQGLVRTYYDLRYHF